MLCLVRFASVLADRPSLMFLRIAMEEHWIVDRRSSSVLDLFPSRRFIPMEKVGERMGLSREWVNLLVSTGRLRSTASVSDPQTTLRAWRICSGLEDE
jgi:hypothetical protein